jgi:hypothetical protein
MVCADNVPEHPIAAAKHVVAYYRRGIRTRNRAFGSIPEALLFLQDGVRKGVFRPDHIDLHSGVTVLNSSEIEALRRRSPFRAKPPAAARLSEHLMRGAAALRPLTSLLFQPTNAPSPDQHPLPRRST